MYTCMVRKQRVETYLNPKTVEELEQMDATLSKFIREAVNEKLEGEQ